MGGCDSMLCVFENDWLAIPKTLCTLYEKWKWDVLDAT